MVWITGSENDKADFLSCIVDNDDWGISELDLSDHII
jgi:hypothetical protein